MSNILFIFEGEKTEKNILNSLTKYFINEQENTLITCAYCAEIYQLYKEISKDDNLDTFTLLKEKKINKELLAPYSRNDFAEIYMFFDYDGHSTLASDKKIEELLNLFNEETEKGKLYLNYPMVESLKHIKSLENFKNSKVKAKENIRYKQKVNSESKNEFIQINKYTKDIWIQLINLHLKKANFIINDDYIVPLNNISQANVFQKQLEKYINIDSTVSVLSSFPLFLLNYYGVTFITKLISEVHLSTSKNHQ
ncbi:hypothetical protein [Tenacibaculum finnmarkense]|nr:hypothetical protein [Tenacibaculum finnmarkense]MBE7647682.1 hypothetical protein [Tenacibaculum finnmarkense genomovar ulcerans]